jgi:hypothetical protein
VLTSVTGESVFTSSEAAEVIQWAIDHSEAGGGVELSAGTFRLNTVLKVPGNIWLHGSGDGSVLKVLHDQEDALALEKAYNTTISDFTIEQAGGANTGISVRKSILTQIQNVTVKGFSQYGLHFKGDTENLPPNTWYNNAGPSLILVSESRFIDNRSAHIYKPVCGAYIGNAIPTMFTRNITWGGQRGIVCEGICDNVVGNIVIRAGQNAIVLDHCSLLCTGNMAYQTRGAAIKVFDGKMIYTEKYDRNDNNNNKESNVTGNYLIYQEGAGIELSEQWGTTTDNRIINSGVGVGYKSGIWLREDSESFAVVENLIYNEEEQFPLLNGITENGIKNLVVGNRIYNYTNEAVNSKGEATLVAGNSGKASPKTQKGAAWKYDDTINWTLTYPELRDYLTKLTEKKPE